MGQTQAAPGTGLPLQLFPLVGFLLQQVGQGPVLPAWPPRARPERRLLPPAHLLPDAILPEDAAALRRPVPLPPGPLPGKKPKTFPAAASRPPGAGCLPAAGYAAPSGAVLPAGRPFAKNPRRPGLRPDAAGPPDRYGCCPDHFPHGGRPFPVHPAAGAGGPLCGTVAGVLRRLAQHFQMPEPVGILRRYGASVSSSRAASGTRRASVSPCRRCRRESSCCSSSSRRKQLSIPSRAAWTVPGVRSSGRPSECGHRVQVSGPSPAGRAASCVRQRAVLQYLATAFQQPGTGRGLGSGLLMSGTGLFRFPAKGKAAADSLRQAGAGGIGREQGQQVAQGLFRLLQGRGRWSGIVPGCAAVPPPVWRRRLPARKAALPLPGQRPSPWLRAAWPASGFPRLVWRQGVPAPARPVGPAFA